MTTPQQPTSAGGRGIERGPGDLVEASPTGLLKPEQQLALKIAWYRFGALRDSDLVQNAWRSQFNAEPEVFPSNPVRSGQAVIVDGDNHQYGLHPIAFAGQRKLSIYDSPEDENGIDLFISKDNIDGVDHSTSQPRYLGAEEAIRRYWEALNAFPDVTGKWKMPEQATPGLNVASLTEIDHTLREGGSMHIRSINEWRLRHSDLGLRSLISVRLLNAFDNDLDTVGYNSYVEAALREVNANRQAEISVSKVSSRDVPPAEESLLNWFVRLGGGIDFRGSSIHQIAVDFSAAGTHLGRLGVTDYFAGRPNVFGTFKEAMAAVEANIASFKNQLSPDDRLLLE